MDQEKRIVCDEAEVVKIVKATMLPDIHELKTEISLLRKDIQHLLEDKSETHRKIDAEILELKEKYESLRVALFGNGKQEGLEVKLSKVLDWMSTRVWFERLIIAAVAAQIIIMLANLLSK